MDVLLLLLLLLLPLPLRQVPEVDHVITSYSPQLTTTAAAVAAGAVGILNFFLLWSSLDTPQCSLTPG